MGTLSRERARDLAEAPAHYAEPSPSADGCARRVAFDGWSYMLVPTRGGDVLVTEEAYRRLRFAERTGGVYGGADDNFRERVRLGRDDIAVCLRVTSGGEVVAPDGEVVGHRGDLRSTVRKPGTSPLKGSPRDGVSCCCAGCAPVAVDDGRRPRGMVLQTQESTANVMQMRTRKLQVESRVPPADADVPECAGCGKPNPIACDNICWQCLANGYLNGGA